jgi:hypothetical protein
VRDLGLAAQHPAAQCLVDAQVRADVMARATAAAVALAVGLLGCGGATSPATLPPTMPTALATSAASASPGFGTVATALDGATSYRFSVVLDTGPAAGGPSPDASPGASPAAGGPVPGAMSGVMVLRPTRAFRMDWITVTGAIATITVIGERGWIRSARGALNEVPAATAAAGGPLSDVRPERLFALQLDAYAAGLAVIGREVVNGVAAIHVRPTPSALAAVAAEQGLGADLAADAWVAEDGGYLVRGIASGSSPQGVFRLVIDISGVNDPANAVSPPG